MSYCVILEILLAWQYPEEELRWLAVHAYNRAVDFYAEDKNDLWLCWTRLALRLAKTVGDPRLYDHISGCIAEAGKI